MITSPPSEITIGIIILTWNESEKTTQLLERISDFCSANTNIQAVLVDNGSESSISATLLRAAPIEDKSVIYVKSESNKGFGAGMNLGYETLVNHFKCDYFWFLNNDTLPALNALTNLLDYLADNKEKKIIGCTILDPGSKVIQCAGGCKYNSWLALDRPLMKGKPVDYLKTISVPTTALDYAYGASFLVESGFFTRAGGFSSDYFLFYEELELATHCTKSEIGWCKNAFVEHSPGTTTLRDDALTIFSTYHAALSSFRFTKKHFAWKLPTVMATRLLGKGLHAVAQGKPLLIKAVWLAIQDFFSNKLRDQPDLMTG